jgi:PAS domain S-box-containing protein
MITFNYIRYIRNTTSFITFIIILSFMLLSGCAEKHSDKKPPRAVAGVLDLRNWNFKKDGPILLRGEAEFYWKKILKPDDFTAEGKNAKPDYIHIPGTWKGQVFQGKTLPGPGYATYRLTILLNHAENILAMKLLDMSEAHVIHINGSIVESRGIIGTDINTTTPAFTRGMTSFSSTGIDRLEMIINASNYLEKLGAAQIILGRDVDIHQISENEIASDLFLFSSILLMGLYHLSIFLFRRKDKSPLYFGIYCLLIAYFTIYNGERFIFNIFPGIEWVITNRLLHLSVYISVVFFGMFLYELFPQEFIKPVVRILQICGTLFSLVVITTPLSIYPHTMMPYQVILILACVYTIYALIMAARHRRDGAIIFLAGFFILFLTVINDVLSDNKIIHTGNIIPFGLFIFIFSQTYILSIRFSRSFSSVERLSDELQKTNRQLFNTWNYLINVFNSIPSILVSVDKDGIITQWNTAAERFNGIPAAEAISKSLWEIMPYLRGYREVFDTVIKSSRPEELLMESFEIKGETKYMNISINPLLYEGDDGAVIRVDDITELEKKDSQLRQAQKMETVGTLAGGLAHDFNNVLGGITGAISLIKHDLGKKEINMSRVMEMIKLLEESSCRAADMVHQLLTLSKKHELTLSPVDLNHTIERVLKICSNTFDKSIEIKPIYYDGTVMVKADPAQMEQVALNLCVNASHAMTIMKKEGETIGGALIVSIDRLYADKFFCKTHPEADPGCYWMISYRDTGVGMDLKTMSKIFDPFFTTKKTEKGTGLGLAMVYNIVQQHGGFVDVYSEPGIGSTFNVFLPELEGDSGSIRAADMEQTISSGSGLVLVVDDEEIIRFTATSILEECGYDVITASNGEEAMDLFRNRHGEIRAVLLDVAMPKKSGAETFEEMKNIDPAVKILLTSGFKMDDRVQKLLARGVNDFIQKPYSMVELSKKMKKIIG